jgi:C4-dicarboxylate transporter, DctM subunit
MTIIVLVAAFAILVFLGLPISYAMGASSLVAVLYNGQIPLNLLVHRTVMGVNSFVLLAIPLFIFAGIIMERGGLSPRLVEFARTLVGRFRGGLAMGVVVGSMLMAGVTGSMVAEVSALCAMTLVPLERAGYGRPYSLSLIGSSCAFAYLLPPHILMVIVAAVANVSVIALFAAGVLPAVFLGILMIGLVHIQARLYDLPRDKACSLKEILKGLTDGALALGVPFLLFGGIRLGVATVTEMAAILVVYALIVGAFVYRKLTWRSVLDAMIQTAVATGAITMLLGFATIFAFLIATQGVPTALASWLLDAHVPAWGVLVITALLFITVGSVLEGAPAALIFVPILLPVIQALHIDVVHWLTIVVLGSAIGLFLPPTGLAVLTACGIGKVKMESLFRPMMPFLAVLFLGTLILIFVPQITTFLPTMLGLRY